LFPGEGCFPLPQANLFETKFTNPGEIFYRGKKQIPGLASAPIVWATPSRRPRLNDNKIIFTSSMQLLFTALNRPERKIPSLWKRWNRYWLPENRPLFPGVSLTYWNLSNACLVQTSVDWGWV